MNIDPEKIEAAERIAGRAAKATARRAFLNDDGSVSARKVAANVFMPGAGALLSGAPKTEPTPEPVAEKAPVAVMPDPNALACPRCGCTTFRQDAKLTRKVLMGVWAKRHLYCAKCGEQVDR